MEEDEDEFFEQLMSHCLCNPCCRFEGAKSASQSSAAQSVTERITLARGMLFSLSSPPGAKNDFKLYSRSKKRLFTENYDSTHCVVQYGYQGRTICRKAFSAIVNLGKKTVQRHAQEVSSSTSVKVYTTQRDTCRLGKPAAQTLIVCAFLEHYSDRNGLPDPRGCIQGSDRERRFLSSSTTKASVYNEYCEKWKNISTAAFSKGLIKKLLKILKLHTILASLGGTFF